MSVVMNRLVEVEDSVVWKGGVHELQDGCV